MRRCGITKIKQRSLLSFWEFNSKAVSLYNKPTVLIRENSKETFDYLPLYVVLITKFLEGFEHV